MVGFRYNFSVSGLHVWSKMFCVLFTISYRGIMFRIAIFAYICFLVYKFDTHATNSDDEHCSKSIESTTNKQKNYQKDIQFRILNYISIEIVRKDKTLLKIIQKLIYYA